MSYSREAKVAQDAGVDVLQIKDAIRDGLRAVSNTLLDGFVVRGSGAFEVGPFQTSAPGTPVILSQCLCSSPANIGTLFQAASRGHVPALCPYRELLQGCACKMGG